MPIAASVYRFAIWLPGFYNASRSSLDRPIRDLNLDTVSLPCRGPRLMAGIRLSDTGRTTLAGLPSNRVRRAAWKAAHHCEQRLAGTFHVTSRSEIVERGFNCPRVLTTRATRH